VIEIGLNATRRLSEKLEVTDVHDINAEQEESIAGHLGNSRRQLAKRNVRRRRSKRFRAECSNTTFDEEDEEVDDGYNRRQLAKRNVRRRRNRRFRAFDSGEWLESLTVSIGSNETGGVCMKDFGVINSSFHPDYCCGEPDGNAVILYLDVSTKDFAEASVSECLVNCEDGDEACNEQCKESKFRSAGSKELFPSTNNGTGAAVGQNVLVVNGTDCGIDSNIDGGVICVQQDATAPCVGKPGNALLGIHPTTGLEMVTAIAEGDCNSSEARAYAPLNMMTNWLCGNNGIYCPPQESTVLTPTEKDALILQQGETIAQLNETNVELQQYNAQLNEANVELQQYNAQLNEVNVELQQDNAQLNDILTDLKETGILSGDSVCSWASSWNNSQQQCELQCGMEEAANRRLLFGRLQWCRDKHCGLLPLTPPLLPPSLPPSSPPPCAPPPALPPSAQPSMPPTVPPSTPPLLPPPSPPHLPPPPLVPCKVTCATVGRFYKSNDCCKGNASKLISQPAVSHLPTFLLCSEVFAFYKEKRCCNRAPTKCI